MFNINNITRTAATLALSAFAFVSCLEIDDQQSGALGYLEAPELDVDVTVEDLTQTKALDFEVVAPGPSAVRFVVKDKDGNVKYDGQGLWTEPLVLPVGAYTIEATSGVNGFGAPYFTGSASGSISPLANEVPQLELALDNSLVYVTVEESFADHFKAEKVVLNSGEFEAAFGEWFYVPSGSDLSLLLVGKNSAGNPAEFAYTLADPSEEVAYRVTCGQKTTDWPSISLSLNDEEAWASRIYITTPASFSGNISPENKASVVYEAIPSTSSDWTSAASAVTENGVLVIKGLTPGTEYQVRARVGALISNVVKVTPALDGFSATASHTYSGGELDGTDVTSTFSKPDVVKNSIASWSINLCKADGTELRSELQLGTSVGAAITATNGWPYLPVGSYKLVAKATMKDGDVVDIETPFSTIHPSFAVMPTCKTTYDYYRAGDRSNANAESGSKTSEASSPNHSLFEIGSSVGISSNLMQNTNYSKTVYYAAKKDNTVVIDATVDFGTSKSNSVGDIHDLFTDWRAYTLSVTVTFAGSPVTATDDFHITGLPYSVSFYDNTAPSGWSFSNNDSGGSRLILKEGGSSALSSSFHVPANINIKANLNAYAYGGSIPKQYKPTVNFNASNTSTNDGNVEATLQGVNLLPNGGATYTDISGDLTLSTSAVRVCIYVNGNKYWSSVGGVSIGVVCDHFSALYR